MTGEVLNVFSRPGLLGTVDALDDINIRKSIVFFGDCSYDTNVGSMVRAFARTDGTDVLSTLRLAPATVLVTLGGDNRDLWQGSFLAARKRMSGVDSNLKQVWCKAHHTALALWAGRLPIWQYIDSSDVDWQLELSHVSKL